MKKVLVLAAIALGAILLFLGLQSPSATPQQKASHMIVMLGDDGEGVGTCTATAVGPHALMTAEHCDTDKDAFPTINIDLSTRSYNILDRVKDGRDHLLLYVDGPAFRNIETVSTRTPQIGDKVYIHGNGGREYPSRRLSGEVIPDTDPSDVDEDAGIFRTDIPVIPGDSGSAVYAADGKIVGVVTYGWDESSFLGLYPKLQNKNFSLAFTQEQLDAAKDPLFRVVPDAEKETDHADSSKHHRKHHKLGKKDELQP